MKTIIKIVLKSLVVLILLSSVGYALEVVSEKEVRRDQIGLGEAVYGGDVTLEVRGVKREGDHLSVQLAMTAHDTYGYLIHKDYSPVDFYSLDEPRELSWSDEPLEVRVDETFIDTYQPQKAGDSLNIPVGQTKVIDLLVKVPEDSGWITMNYTSYSGRTYYDLRFDLPIS